MRKTAELACGILGVALLYAGACLKAGAAQEARNTLAGEFRWQVRSPILAAANRPQDPCFSVKDPSFVYVDGRYHLFTTIRSKHRTHQIEYCSFRDWSEANRAERHVLRLTDGYFCAPQVFWFSPQRTWYLVYQASNETKSDIQPVYSTTTNLAEPDSWTRPRPMYPQKPGNVKNWIDFWVICDAAKAHLFFTSMDGRMWRAETGLKDFPLGWTEPKVTLQADIFEAAHVYSLKEERKYLALIEAQAEGRRYYKAFVAEKLSEEWKPLAASRDKPFASSGNVQDLSGHWTDSFSHGELVRSGFDEKMEVDSSHLRFVFQGVSELRKQGKPYGEIPWELGLLEGLE